MKNKKDTMPWKEAIRLQKQLYHLCMENAGGLFFFHLFHSAKIEAIIFVEHIWWVQYALHTVETGGSFDSLIRVVFALLLLFLVNQVLNACYRQWGQEKLKNILYAAFRKKIYVKAGSLDLKDYDDPGHYDRFILSISEADRCVDRFLETTGDLCSVCCALLLYTGYIMKSGWSGMLIVALCSLSSLLAESHQDALSIALRLEKNTDERKRNYIRRTFYLNRYAKEIRLYPEYQGTLLERSAESCAGIRRSIRLYAGRLWAWRFLKEHVSKDIMIYGIYIPFLLRDVLVLHRLSISTMIVLIYAVRQLSADCGRLAEIIPKIQMNSIYLEKIDGLMKRVPGLTGGNRRMDGIREVVMKDVCFSYGRGKEVLHEISLSVQSGQKIAVVGYNGAGKSTLAKLLLRLYEPTGGEIWMNGVRIEEYDLNDLHRSAGAVLQDFNIYPLTLKENVIMGPDGEEAVSRKVREALDAVDFYGTGRTGETGLDDMLLTEFGNGRQLSGGEAQKVAVARCLYAGNSLIIMDEPTSALDPIMEYRLNALIGRLAERAIVIYITHRLSTTRDADRIILLENGRIAEEGTHETLLAEKGRYAQMWEVQAARYREGKV